MWFCHQSLGYGKAKVVARWGCVTFPSDDVTQFTGCSHLSLLYYLWLQTSPRSSCFYYHQHDWITQQLLHFHTWKLGSTHRSIAPHLPPHPSHLSVRPKIGVLTVTHRLFKKTTFSQQPSPLHHDYYYYYYYYITTATTTTTNHHPLATCPGSTTLAHLATSSRHFNITQHTNSSFSSKSPAHHFHLSSCRHVHLPDYSTVWYSIKIKWTKTLTFLEKYWSFCCVLRKNKQRIWLFGHNHKPVGSWYTRVSQ